MTRTHSKHGLERKFKSWRKGKGNGSGAKSSLKNQLRSQTRLLQKAKTTGNYESIQQIQERVNDLEHQINLKSHAELERKYSTK